MKFPLTDIGEGIKEVEVIQWFVQTGGEIQEFDKLCEVMSDKANVEITSPLDGIVHELHWKVGEMAQVGEPLLTFKVAGGASDAPASAAADSAPAQTPAAAVSQTIAKASQGSGIQTTPAVRRIAKEYNVDLQLVTGTGPNGRILKEDMLAYIKNPAGQTSVPISTPEPVSPPVTSIPPPAAPKYSAPAPLKEDRVVPVTGVQKFMVKKMTEANSVPQFGYGDEICMDSLIRIRSLLKPAAEKMGLKLSYLPFILKATSLSLAEYPMLNAHVNSECTEVIERGSHNLGVAIDSPQGLVVPNIKDCQNKSVLEIAQDLDALVVRIRDKKTTTADITGGTFTLSNIGAIGGTVCRPIVFVPEVCIGALGKTQKVASFNEKNEVVPKSMMHVAWSADHRIIDGATVARFSNRWKQYIENPEQMLLHLK